MDGRIDGWLEGEGRREVGRVAARNSSERRTNHNGIRKGMYAAPYVPRSCRAIQRELENTPYTYEYTPTGASRYTVSRPDCTALRSARPQSVDEAWSAAVRRMFCLREGGRRRCLLAKELESQRLQVLGGPTRVLWGEARARRLTAKEGWKEGKRRREGRQGRILRHKNKNGRDFRRGGSNWGPPLDPAMDPRRELQPLPCIVHRTPQVLQ
ncbi:hypothetical protein Mp_2g26480 [Marchantia polymorpha subsp. ruderalis]|uniref:Uncharacterized protein n=1 Tax=Marchantia polymorpha TaxID=3197 RepID=A0A2R6XB43_MARPO|nr:hypothetical protein MARPO_0025s0036 [Marchantia polymorpha]BBN03794.1 hypothetical protein Mp_2g26480 [Marchantia polymorpha subsp. ruderalis]|eukprot:PTQ43341.1 hypothetical protein MARPO_0025s0036 [Marchantia polymorpha]